jgi:hypothetical protein
VVKWILTIVAVFAVAMYASTAWVSYSWFRKADHFEWIQAWVIVRGGGLNLTRLDANDYLWSNSYDPALDPPRTGIDRCDYPGLNCWCPHWREWPSVGSNGSVTSIPLWPIPLAFTIAAALSWKSHRRATYLSRSNLCRTCGYDRTGLPTNVSLCTECGGQV